MSGVLRLDVIIPTFNRCALLSGMLESLRVARIPPSLEVTITVVDNGSRDGTREVVHSFQPGFGGRLRYLFEERKGKSYALNAGIEATAGDLIGQVDDDEKVDPAWFEVVDLWFRNEDIDFIGGPYVPEWEVPRPAWLPEEYCGIIGACGVMPGIRTFGKDDSVMLPGGNAVIRREIMQRAGPYSVACLTFEDDDMYQRLLATGGQGKYVPELVIFHHIPAARLTKAYFRSWVFRLGIYRAKQQRRNPEPVPHLLGVPRYLYGRAARVCVGLVGKAVRGQLNPAGIMSAELSWRSLAGFFYGRNFLGQ